MHTSYIQATYHMFHAHFVYSLSTTSFLPLLLHSKSLFNFTCFVIMCIHRCSFSSHDWWVEHMCFFTQHLSPFYNRITDNCRLRRIRIATAEREFRGKCSLPHFVGLRRPWMPFICWSIKLKFGVHVAVATTYLRDQKQGPLLTALVLCSHPIMWGAW